MATVVTDRAAFLETARDAPEAARIPVEVRVTVDDPFAAYRRGRRGPGGCYLETTGGQSGWGYFGLDPTERLVVRPEAVPLAPSSVGPSLAALAGRLAGERLVRGACEVPYPCGLIGWLSYDIARELESLPETTVEDRDLPRLEVCLYETLAAWEEPRDEPTRLRVTSCPRVTADPTTTYRRGRARALAMARRVTSGEPDSPGGARTATAAQFRSECGRAAFVDRVRRVQSAVREGETFQANISHRLVAPAVTHPVAVFAALRRANPAPYSALLEFPSMDLVSASPELLLDRVGDRVRTEPIAGTRPRGETPDDDARYERYLLADEKERAEHAMLVDLERNDVGKMATYGSVDVTEYRRVDRYSEVMHLVSNVTGRLREGEDPASIVAAMFPGGTVTGAPKPRTMAIIDEVEATRRGPYTGSVGLFGFDDRMTLSIVIRTLIRHNDRYSLRVGSGIVHDSDPDREYEETLDKARALVAAVDRALDDRVALTVESA